MRQQKSMYLHKEKVNQETMKDDIPSVNNEVNLDDEKRMEEEIRSLYFDSSTNEHLDSSNVFFHSFPLNYSEKNIQQLFSRFGEIKYFKKNPTYGFVNFKSPRDALKAVRELDNFNLGRRSLRVSFAKLSNTCRDRKKVARFHRLIVDQVLEDMKKEADNKKAAIVAVKPNSSKISKLKQDCTFAHTSDEIVMKKLGQSDAVVPFRPKSMANKFEATMVTHEGKKDDRSAMATYIANNNHNIVGHWTNDTEDAVKAKLKSAQESKDIAIVSKLEAEINKLRDELSRAEQRAAEAEEKISAVNTNKCDIDKISADDKKLVAEAEEEISADDKKLIANNTDKMSAKFQSQTSTSTGSYITIITEETIVMDDDSDEEDKKDSTSKAAETKEGSDEAKKADSKVDSKKSESKDKVGSKRLEAKDESNEDKKSEKEKAEVAAHGVLGFRTEGSTTPLQGDNCS